VYLPGLMTERALIVVPTYNERDNVNEVATAFLAAVEGAEILFVDDNSPDGTGEVLDGIAAENPRIHVMHRPGKLGLGTAYLDGFRWGLERDYAYLFEMDADFSHDPRYLPGMLEAAREGADMVVGSRYVEGGGTVNWGIGRQIISRAGSLYARTVLGVGVRDLTSGFICYRRQTLEVLDLGAVQSNGYSFQIEMSTACCVPA
jgi:dolichol-phosphate mannosyltransferase